MSKGLVELLLKKIETQTYVGLGYIIVPPDTDRGEYITTCYAKETVSFYPDAGGVSYNNIHLSVEALQEIEFPEGSERFGSCVVFILHPTQKIPIIIGVINKLSESLTLNYKEFKLQKSLGENSVTISGRGDRGNLFVSVNSDDEYGGKINIKISKTTKDGEFILEVQGNIKIISTKLSFENEEIEILSETSAIIKTKEFTLEADNIKFKGKKLIELGEKNLEKAVLGDTLLNDIIKPLLTALKTSPLVTPGTTGVINPIILTQLESIETKLSSILSQKVKLE